jgi:hypothetical protein
VTCADDLTWDSLVRATSTRDAYFRSGYARAYEKAGHGRAIAVIISAGESRFLVPLLLRPLSELTFAQGISGYDATTPYGYGGLLRLSGPVDGSAETLLLLESLRKWCADTGVVSILLRLHPLLEQEQWFSARMEGAALLSVGLTVALDLQRWDTEREALMTLRKGRRSDLGFARRRLNLTWASDKPSTAHESLQLFRVLYEHRMDQLQAGKFYYFPPEYYTELASGLGTDLDVAIAWLGDEPVGGAIFIAGREFAHYHLSATSELGRLYKASTLLINNACGWAWRRGCRWLHLGGGKRDADPLFQFKESFGGSLFRCSLVRFVGDSNRYKELTAIRFADASLPAPRSDFFPEYRA